MTARYCGIGGNDGSSGLTWALRKLTLNGVEDTPVVAGDVVYIGPGVYRELLTMDVNGGNAYSVGSVDVTNGSKQVGGNGTTFVGNVGIGYMFHITVVAAAADGVGNGTATFTSAGGNFQVSMIGKIIQINTENAYKIGAVATANSITLVDVNGVGWPGVGGGLTYSVMSGEGHYEVASVDNNTTLQLTEPWNGPTLTTIAYLTYNPIKYLADVTGENTDGVGGLVRITGSDNDQTVARASCITDGGAVRKYRTFSGFAVDMVTGPLINMKAAGGSNFLLENCYGLVGADNGVALYGAAGQHTIRNCFFINPYSLSSVLFQHSATYDDSGNIVENSIFLGGPGSVVSTRVGGVTVKNCISMFCNQSGGGLLAVATALAVGQTVVVVNSIMASGRMGLKGTVIGEVTEDYNTFYGNSADRSNTTVGSNSKTYPPLFNSPILRSGFKFPWQPFELSKWSEIRALTGAWEAANDFFGVSRPATASKNSWGPIQFCDMERETGTKHAGPASLCLHDAGRHQMFVPVTNISTTISVYVYREANYAGNLPQMIVKQPGQPDDVTTDTAAVSQWNLLTTTLTPAAGTDFVVVELVSRNTAGAGNYDVFFDDLA